MARRLTNRCVSVNSIFNVQSCLCGGGGGGGDGLIMTLVRRVENGER